MATHHLADLNGKTLLATCKLAQERRELQAAGRLRGSSYRPPYEVSSPASVTNAELLQLKPLYLELINEPALHDECLNIIETLEPDGAAAALYVLEYPGLTAQSRFDVSGLSGSTNVEGFPLQDVVKSISADQRLLRWCRCAIAAPGLHCEPVLQSALQLLVTASSSSNLRKGGNRRRFCAFVLQDPEAGAEEAALISLFEHLAKVLKKPTLAAAAVVHCHSLVMRGVKLVVDSTEPERAFLRLFANRASSREWRSALARCRPDMGELADDMLSHLDRRCAAQERRDILLAPGVGANVTARSVQPHEEVCAGPECTNAGVQKCGRCKLVSYCGPVCQKAHWKAHKKVCAKAAGDSSRAELQAALQGEMASMRLDSSNLRVSQERRCEETGFDYIITADARQDLGLSFENAFMGIAFRTAKLVAGDRSRDRRQRHGALCRMLDTIATNAVRFGVSRAQVHTQLEAEYEPFNPDGPARFDMSKGDLETVMDRLP